MVRAVVVSDGRAPGLGAALDALVAQDPAPDATHLVLTADVEPPDHGWPAHVDVHRVQATSFGGAVSELLTDVPAVEHELLWLIHDDLAPLPGALADLTAVARKRRRAGVIGAAQVRWDDPSRLVSLGTTTSRIGARRVPLVDYDDVNQGQYDDRDDVLAVSLGGALVRRDVWHTLDGVDPAYEGWSESLDFCRRSWRSGYDVVVVPTAKVRHSQERLYGRRGGSGGGRRSTYAARRASEWYHAASYAPWWAVPLLMVWTWFSALARALLRIAQNEPRMVASDLLVPWWLITRLARLPRSRKRVRKAGRVGKVAEKELLAGPRMVARHVRALEFGTRDRRLAAAAPTDEVKAELAVARGRRRVTLAAVIVGLAGVSIAWHPDWFVGLARGQMLAGEALGVTDVGAGQLWARAFSGWSSQGLGAPALDAGLSGLLAPLALLPGGLPVTLGLTLALAPLFAGIAAWAAAGAFTRSLAARSLAAVIYGLWPAALSSIEQGRVAAVIVHIALPWAVLGLTRAGGWQRGERIGGGDEHPERRLASPSAGMGAAAILGIVVIAAPVMLAPVLIVVGVLGALAGRQRWRLWGTLVPAVVVSVPGIVAAVRVGGADALGILTREPGPSAAAPVQTALELLTGLHGGAAGVPQLLGTASQALAVLVVAGAAVVALVGSRRTLGALMLVVAAGGLAIAVLSQGVTLSPASGAGGASAAGWYGSGMSLVAVALLVTWCATTADAWFAGEGAARAWRRVAMLGVASVVAVATVGVATAQVWPGRESLGDVATTPRDVLPLVAAIEQDTSARQRVLTLTDRDGVVEYSVLSRDGVELLTSAAPLLSDGRPAVRPHAPEVASVASLGEAVAGLMTGDNAAVNEVSAWGIGVVVAAPGSDVIAESLAQTRSLQLMGASERGTAWRVGGGDSTDKVARAWFEPAVESEVVRTPADVGRLGGSVEATQAGTLIIAESADAGWNATLNGENLAAVPDEYGRQAFAVNAAGTIEYSYDDRAYRVWFWVAVATLVWAAIGAIPARSRRSRTEDNA